KGRTPHGSNSSPEAAARRAPSVALVGERALALLGRQVPRREDLRALARDRDRELEVRRRRAVLGVARPALAPAQHTALARGRHRLDREHPTLLKQRALD